MSTHAAIVRDVAEATAKDLKYLAWTSVGAEIFSTCGKGRYMAVIVDANGYVAGVGYNGGPHGWVHCVDGGCPRYLEDTPSGSDYSNCIAIHAEQNSLLHSAGSVRGATVYVNGEVCFTCAKLLANASIRRVVYLVGRDAVDAGAAVAFMEQCGIDVVAVERDELEPVWTFA